MNFLLSEQQIGMQHALGRMLKERCDSAQLHRVFDGDSGFDEALWQSLSQMGVPGLLVPEAFGGAGLELIDLALCAEVLGAAAAPAPFLGHSLATLAITLAGSAGQKRKWLPKLANGELIAAMAFAESEERWQPDEWRLTAESQLSGAKSFVTFAPQASLFVIGVQGPGIVIAEANADGLKIEPFDNIDRTRRCSRLICEATPVEALPHGAEHTERIRDAALVLLAADAFGGASRCVELAVEYAKVREQYGVPIAQFQALKHQLANMAVEIEPARGLYWFAAHAFDHLPEQRARAAALAKAHVTDRFLQIARDTVEVHGGVGYTWEYDIQIYLKRAMFDYAYLGQPAIHRARYAALAGWCLPERTHGHAA